MTYSMRIGGVIKLLLGSQTSGIQGEMVSDAITHLENIAGELDKTPRDNSPNCHGQPMELVASFPYPHPEDRGNKRLALYNKPCTSGDGSGEYVIWTELREPEHNGFREAARFWGDYAGYHNADEEGGVLYAMLDKFTYKCARIVGPYVPAEHRGYRRSS